MNALSLLAALLLVAAAFALTPGAATAQAPAPCKAGKALPRTDKADDAEPAVLRANLARAKSFMADNAKEAGVVKMRSGVQYKIVNSAPADAACVNPDLRLRIQYEGSLADGTVFDTNMGGAPSIYRLDELIQRLIRPQRGNRSPPEARGPMYLS